ncbi:hypothetical protein CapIbe_014356 [Capra ibex]
MNQEVCTVNIASVTFQQCAHSHGDSSLWSIKWDKSYRIDSGLICEGNRHTRMFEEPRWGRISSWELLLSFDWREYGPPAHIL